MAIHRQCTSPLLFQCNHAASVTVLQAEFWKAKAARIEAGEEAGEDHVMLFDDEPSYSAKEVPIRDCHSAPARNPLRVFSYCRIGQAARSRPPSLPTNNHALCVCVCSRWPL